MQDSPRFVHVEPGGGRCIASRNILMNVKVGADDTGGELTLIAATLPKGEGPPLHVHERENEGYYVLSGTFEFLCGKRRVAGGPGTFVFAPRREPHRYKNIGDGAGELLFVFTPAGIERFFSRGAREADRLARAQIAREFGITMLE